MKKTTYKSAGVDIKAGDHLVDFVKSLARGRKDPGLVAGVGGFGALYRVPMKGKKPPLLVSGTDGVGTKLKIAFRTGRHDTIGIDCVAMCANDVACQGARPIFFLDYLGIGKLDLRTGRQVIKGVVEGCNQAGCSLIGGETAELPGLYGKGEYDLVGFCVGAVEEAEMVDGQKARAGDVIIGVGSNGLHSNGFSLANKVLLETGKLPLNREVPDLGCTLADELLRPTRIYVRTILRLMGAVPVLALGHITGGGMPVKGPRQLPRGLGFRIHSGSWPVPPVFRLIERMGRVDRMEMFRTFNMGLGLTVVVRKNSVGAALKCLLDAGERAQVVGEVIRGPRFKLI